MNDGAVLCKFGAVLVHAALRSRVWESTPPLKKLLKISSVTQPGLFDFV